MGKYVTFKEHTSFIVKMKKVRDTLNTITSDNLSTLNASSPNVEINPNNTHDTITDVISIMNDMIESIDDNRVVILNNVDNIEKNTEEIGKKLGLEQASHDQLAIDNLITAVNKFIHNKNLSLMTVDVDMVPDRIEKKI